MYAQHGNLVRICKHVARHASHAGGVSALSVDVAEEQLAAAPERAELVEATPDGGSVLPCASSPAAGYVHSLINGCSAHRSRPAVLLRRQRSFARRGRGNNLNSVIARHPRRRGGVSPRHSTAYEPGARRGHVESGSCHVDSLFPLITPSVPPTYVSFPPIHPTHLPSRSK